MVMYKPRFPAPTMKKRTQKLMNSGANARAVDEHSSNQTVRYNVMRRPILNGKKTNWRVMQEMDYVDTMRYSISEENAVQGVDSIILQLSLFVRLCSPTKLNVEMRLQVKPVSY